MKKINQALCALVMSYSLLAASCRKDAAYVFSVDYDQNGVVEDYAFRDKKLYEVDSTAKTFRPVSNERLENLLLWVHYFKIPQESRNKEGKLEFSDCQSDRGMKVCFPIGANYAANKIALSASEREVITRTRWIELETYLLREWKKE